MSECPRHGLPYGSYAALLAVFDLGTAALFLGAADDERLDLGDTALLGVATHKLSRLVTTDRVTSVLRAPFTEQREEGGTIEEEPAGPGPRRALGQLVTCPYCIGPWVSALLLTGLRRRPGPVRMFLTTFTSVAISDFLHQAYAALKAKS